MSKKIVGFTIGGILIVVFFLIYQSSGRWTEEPFTIVVLPDTQIYSKSYPEIFTNQTQWILDHKEEKNIVFVLHEGDITQNNNEAQWENAYMSMSILNGEIPYAIIPGNHDMGYNGDANTRDTTLYNRYFPVSNCENMPTFGGVYEPGRFDNSYHLFSAGGRDWLVVALEFGPRDDVLNWANQVVSNYPDRKTIVLTHTYLYYDDTLHGSDPSHKNSPHGYGIANELGGVNDGVEIWNKLVRKHQNILLTFSGHISGDRTGKLISTGDNGNKVYQMLANYQTLENGGNGYLRILEFEPAQKKISVKTYSPYLDHYKSDSENQFELENVELGPVSPYVSTNGNDVR